MPSLAIFVYDLSATGVARNALAVAEHMQAAGFQVTLITCRPGGELAAQAQALRWETLHAAGAAKRSRTADLLASVVKLRRAIRRVKPDILLSAGNHAHLPCWMATRGMARPLRVYRISNDLGHGNASMRASPRRLATRLLVHDAARLILVSPALADDPAFASPKAREKSTIIANGVDVHKVRALAADPQCAPPPAPAGGPVVLGVGRLVPQKNFAALVEAVAIARATRPLRLVILGRGSVDARDALIHQAGDDWLALPGSCDNPFPAMRDAAVVVVPSLWEGAPNVLLEAMACGAPVVASRAAGNAAEILDEGRFGALVDPLDVQGMAAAILAQCDPDRRVLPGERAGVYDRTVALGRYRAVFDALMKRRHPG